MVQGDSRPLFSPPAELYFGKKATVEKVFEVKLGGYEVGGLLSVVGCGTQNPSNAHPLY